MFYNIPLSTDFSSLKFHLNFLVGLLELVLEKVQSGKMQKEENTSFVLTCFKAIDVKLPDWTR